MGLLADVTLFDLVQQGTGVHVTVQGMAVELAESRGDVPAVVQQSDERRR